MRRIVLPLLMLIAACSSSPSPTVFDQNQNGRSGNGQNNGTGSFGGDGNGSGDGSGNGADVIDNGGPCDDNLAVDGDAEAFARAIGACKGLVSARYETMTGGGGTLPQAQHGILGKFGNVVKPREGSSLGVLSTGWAREYDSPSGDGEPFKTESAWLTRSPAPANALPSGYPVSAQGCPSQQGERVYDVAVVTLELQAPANAKGLGFDFDFWSGEWPDFVCSPFNDAFIALVDGKNVSFDAQGNPVSVNNGFFDRCTPNTSTGCDPRATPKTSVCPGGTAELAGTGFDDPGNYCGTQSAGGGATGWLRSQAPVTPGAKVTLQFVIYEAGDGVLDSSVLIDNFHWIASETTTSTTRPPK